MPLLDLTGDSPGYQFQLGLKPVGQDWILGGYPGSDATARYVIGLDACAMRGAWVLTAPGTPRNIDPACWTLSDSTWPVISPRWARCPLCPGRGSGRGDDAPMGAA